MSVDYNDIFGNVKETFNSLGTFQFKPDTDNYETPQQFEDLDLITISDGEGNDEDKKKNRKSKPKRLPKRELSILVDDIDYEPEEPIKTTISNTSNIRRCSKRLKKTKESENDCSVIDISTPPRVSRGRGRGIARQRGRGRQRGRAPRRGRSRANNSIITYHIGDTLEYPDELEDIPMFSTQSNDVIELDDGDITDIDNEEMLVKVEWQSVEMFKFTVRRFQNIKQIYDFFCKKYNVAQDNLLLMYDNKVLQPDDTPDTIGYRDAKLIDGGIVYKNKIKHLNKENCETVESGIQIKFQFKNSKQPLVLYVENNDKLLLAMTKCAERLEIPLNKLRFEFDGDIISGRQTPNDVGLEGGECIDVKIIL